MGGHDKPTVSFPKLDPTMKEIRLLHIASASRPYDPIQCRFSVTSLCFEAGQTMDTCRVPYEALSYVWGLEKHHQHIRVNNSLVEVTVNLYQALQHLRLADQERIIWIDALCINQGDLTERMEQVSLMRDIYEKSGNVVIWLGLSWDYCQLGMEFLERLGRDKGLHIHPNVSPSLEVSQKDITSAEIQECLQKLFSARWWSRVWTVQEWILAKHSVFQCGQHMLDGQLLREGVRNYFDHLEKCCSDLKAHTPSNNKVFHALLAMEKVEYIRLLIDEVSLLYIFSQFRSSREATNISDKVYGMLGLARGLYQGIILPNYQLPAQEVFERTTLELIKRTGSLEVLSHIPKAGERNLDLPSYVPDWTVLAKEDYFYTDWLNWVAHLHLWRASGNTIAELKVISSGAIALRGMIVDKIVQVGSVPGTVIPGVFLEELKTLANPVNTENPSVFWSTICGTLENYFDTCRDNRPFYRRIEQPTDYRNFETWATWYPSYSAHGMTAEVLSVHRPFKVLTAGRKFAVTRDGRLAWCPVKSQAGDVIAVLNGGTVPFVLRPNDGGRYSVVGDAYVQGIMDGDASMGGDTCCKRSAKFIELL
jgi:hypothetical protein